jgi:predicted RNA methylase
MEPKQLVAEGYDRLYRVYEQWGGGHAGRRHRNIDRAIRLRGGLHGTALDLGCGTGLHATAYPVEQGFDVVGVDSSPRSIEAARVTARKPIHP